MELVMLFIVALGVALLTGKWIMAGATSGALIHAPVVFDLVLLAAVLLFLAELMGIDAAWDWISR